MIGGREVFLADQLDLAWRDEGLARSLNTHANSGTRDVRDYDLDIVANEDGLPLAPRDHEHTVAISFPKTCWWEYLESGMTACTPRRLLRFTTIGANRLAVGPDSLSESTVRQRTSVPMCG